MSGAAPRLRLEAVRKAFGSARAVDGVSLAVGAGEFVTLLGASGCGKTTLLRIAAGFTAPDGGRVAIDGADATAAAPAARGMGFVFQSYALFPTKTAAENIGFALRVAGRPRAESAARVREVAAMVAILPLLDRYPHELSGGQQQRVALARAIAPAPRMLLLDEPLAALDARIRHRLRDEIRALTDRLGMTALYVTHDQEEALAISDRVVVMRDGRIEQEAAPADLYLRPASRFVAEFVGQATLLEAEIVQGVPQALGIAWPLAAARADGPCLMVLRPEELAADPDGPLRGIVESARFLGAMLRVGLVLPCGTRIAADLPARHLRPAPGEALALRPIAAPALVPR
ncbi:ABC transporter ATP-binding protein [Roseomonas sp. BU-1]|uniref:ABC transporter ATP-binding protein n=1 Tax=Falsiroseomonas selenitidurans TaxID=2716335 RepID=A0ABX1E388_9PROT|nr:ABC transporter ATP-binding protein [Falsiroseomonas selenitidurans]